MKSLFRGFTLIELAVVIAVFGILAAIAIPKFVDLQREARIAVLNKMHAAVTTGVLLVHNKAVVMGLDLSDSRLDIDLDGDGTDEQLTYGFPKRNHRHTMEWIIADMGEFSYNPGQGYRLKPNCQVSYNDPGATGEVPQISVVSSGC